MKIVLPKSSYKSVDGSSLSDARCAQIVLIYEMLDNMGDRIINYKTIQEEAEIQNLFKKAKDDSVIRTIFPLLKKLGFVNYEGQFPANKCFTDLGTQFVLATRVLNNITIETPNRQEVVERTKSIKYNAQRQGLLNMYKNAEFKNHNMWLALKLLKEFRTIKWNEFLYAIYRVDKGVDFENVINEIKNKRNEISTYEFTREDGAVLPTTCYSYIRSFLEEAGLISNTSKNSSTLTIDADEFFSQINL